jgi:O-antigen/teichoic acid export membrane protein
LLWGTIAMSGAIALGLYFIVPLLLVSVLGQGYSGTEAQIAAMAWVALVFGLEITLGRRLFASHLHRRRAIVVAAGAVMCAIANIVMIPRWGVFGAIYATAFSYFAVIAAYLFSSRRLAPAGRLQQSVMSP